jgi:pyruvate/2-oxoacid:ferredoxin oxidoreductase alpha subunit
MTATSGPGFSLMQEGISYLAGMELPAVIVNVNRAGPGLGNLGPEQSDYFQATRGGGHGGYRTIVLAPASVQEMARQPYLAFSLAFKYRNPVVMLVDAFLGQLKEDIVLPEPEAAEAAHSWAVGQRRDAPQLISSIHLEQADQSAHARHLLTKFRTIEEREPRWEGHLLEDARVVLVGFGVAARLAKSVVHRMRHKGSHVGLLRPITLQPFPYDAVRRLARAGAHFVVVELSGGQMVEDVRAAVAGAARVESVGEVGGLLPRQDAIMQAAEWVYSA